MRLYWRKLHSTKIYLKAKESFISFLKADKTVHLFILVALVLLNICSF